MSNKSEFLTLFLQHQSDLRAFIGSLVRSQSDFDDVLQETVLTLWEKFDEYDVTRPFGAWARGVAAHKIMQWRDRTGRAPTPFSPAAIQIMVDTFDHQPAAMSGAAEALGQCLEQLPSGARQLLTWWYADTWTIDRIARQMGRTRAAAYKILQRLRTRLAECVQRRLASTLERSQ